MASTSVIGSQKPLSNTSSSEQEQLLIDTSSNEHKMIRTTNGSLDVNVKNQYKQGEELVNLQESDELDRKESQGTLLEPEHSDSLASETEKGKPSDGTVAHGLSRLEFFLVFVGLSLAVFLAALDQTIIAVALQAIAKEFQSLSLIGWIGTAYFLTSTAFIPTYGKMADIFGRKPVFMFAIIVFEIGSILCGAASSMIMLIVARAIAGIGGGGIFSLVIIIISDLTPIKERGKYQGIIGACFGLASVIGPLMGGLFVDSISWRWCFYINGPIGVVTIIVVVFLLRLPRVEGNMKDKLGRIDYLGTSLLIATCIFILIPLQSGGSQYAWNDPFIISFFVVGGILLLAFLFVEAKYAQEPIIPMFLFKNRYPVAVFSSSFWMGMSFFSLVFYAPLFFQIVKGVSATQAGVNTIPLIMGVVVFSIFSGVFVSINGRYMPLIACGAIIICVGAGLMSTLDQYSNNGMLVGYLLIAGAGVGLIVQSVLIAAQASVEEIYLAIVTSNTTFFQSIGAVFGLAISSTVFNNRLASNLQKNLAGKPTPPGFDPAFYMNDPSLINNPAVTPPELVQSIMDSFINALQLVFLIVVPFAGLCFISSLFIKKEKLSDEKRKNTSASAAV